MRQWLLVAEMILHAFPAVERLLARYRRLAADPAAGCRHPDQALLSIRTKQFHCQGAAAFACLTPRRGPLLRAIVALQTMSDYLDNLCDRAAWQPEQGDAALLFRHLHLHMREAMAPPRRPSAGNETPPGDAPADGLLALLARECRGALSTLPSYASVAPHVRRLIGLYCDLQCYKHLPPGRRESALREWHARWSGRPGYVGAAARALPWFEFSAACGSTLGAFALMRLAARPDASRAQADAVARAYFPYICGLHILLDYFIDLDEDRASDDLNFAAACGDPGEAVRRLAFFVSRALEVAGRLPDPWFHRAVVRGLLAMYLSDPKAATGSVAPAVARLVRSAGAPAAILLRLCRRLRRLGVVPPSWQPARPAAGLALPPAATGGEGPWNGGT